MEFIYENLKNIADSKNVLMIRPYRKNGKYYLGALTTTKKGFYEVIPLTLPESKFSFYFEPIDYFGKKVGIFYMENFVVLNNWVAFNKNHLKNFGYTDVLEEPKAIDVIAKFNDGSCAFIMRVTKNYYNKNTAYELYNLLRPTKLEPIHYAQNEISDILIDNYLKENMATLTSLKMNSFNER